MEWIDVNDQLPEIDGNKQLLAFCGTEFYSECEIVRYNEWGWHYGTRDTQNMVQNVTHWMPLPEPPKQ